MGLERFIEVGKQNFALANERRRLAAAPKRALEEARSEAYQRRVLIRRFLRAAKKYARHQEKLRLENQHGVSVGDYYRCRKRNGIACEPCKAIVASYVSMKWKTDPKYKAKEKEWLKNNPDKKPNNSRDRARLRGVKTEYYTRKHIFDRDGYDCYLCNEPVDLSAPPVQGQPGWETYPHIEHVVPLSRGGTDTLDNVRIAHAKCNIDKGVRLLPQS